jgi:hypothetical protein
MADDALILANLLKFKQFIESRGVEEDGWRGRVRDGETMADGHGSPRM